MSDVHTPQEWRAEPSLIWTRFDDSDDWVVYHPLSADVHLLTDAAYRLWVLLLEQPRTVDALIAGLAADLGCPADGEFTVATDEAMTLMDRAGLIRPIRS